MFAGNILWKAVLSNLRSHVYFLFCRFFVSCYMIDTPERALLHTIAMIFFKKLSLAIYINCAL